MCGRQSLRALPRTPPTTRFYNHPSPSKKPPNSAGGMTHPRKMCFNNLQAAYPHLNRLRPGWWELVEFLTPVWLVFLDLALPRAACCRPNERYSRRTPYISKAHLDRVRVLA